MSQIEVTIIFSSLSAHSYQLQLPYCTHSTPTGYLTTMRKQNQRISKDFSPDLLSWPHNSVCGRGRQAETYAVESWPFSRWLINFDCFSACDPHCCTMGKCHAYMVCGFLLLAMFYFLIIIMRKREEQPYTSLTTKRKATFLFFSGHSFHTTVTAKSFVTNSKMF